MFVLWSIAAPVVTLEHMVGMRSQLVQLMSKVSCFRRRDAGCAPTYVPAIWRMPTARGIHWRLHFEARQDTLDSLGSASRGKEQ